MEGSTLKITMVQDPRKGETLEFKSKNPIRTGRVVRGNNLPIKDDGISFKHLSVHFESGKWVIQDLDSSNGTLLNDSKLPPLTPFDLRDGDTIKIGESTSIKVNVEDNGKGRLRRNPRRRAAANMGSLAENVGSLAENVGRREVLRRGKGLKEEDNEAKLGLVSENSDQQLENVGLEVENQSRRGGSKKGRVLREEDNAADLDLVGGKCEKVLEDVVVVTKNQGRQKKAKVLGRKVIPFLFSQCLVQDGWKQQHELELCKIYFLVLGESNSNVLF